jgi:hypothetical protein
MKRVGLDSWQKRESLTVERDECISFSAVEVGVKGDESFFLLAEVEVEVERDECVAVEAEVKSDESVFSSAVEVEVEKRPRRR